MMSKPKVEVITIVLYDEDETQSYYYLMQYLEERNLVRGMESLSEAGHAHSLIGNEHYFTTTKTTFTVALLIN